MDDRPPVFGGNPCEIEGVDIDGPLSLAKNPCCEYFGDAYRKAAESATQAGDLRSAAVYQFLFDLTGCYLRAETIDEPFGPAWVMDGRRTFIPSDLIAEDLPVVRSLADATRAPSLRARLCDILWETTGDYKAMVEAAHAYCTSGKELCKDDTNPAR
jgi:hypothetical protein